MSNKPSINPTFRTLTAGQSKEIPAGGAEIFIRKLEGASEIEIALDNGEWLPVAAGEGFAAPHEKFKVRNPNAATVKVTVLQSTHAGVYIDRRDTATTVQIGETPTVVNSPYSDEGGNIRKIGGSYYSSQFAGASENTILNAASNTNGVRLRTAVMGVTVAGSAGPYGAEIRYVIGASKRRLFAADYGKTGVFSFIENGEFHIPSGYGLDFNIPAGDTVHATVNYDIL